MNFSKFVMYDRALYDPVGHCHVSSLDQPRSTRLSVYFVESRRNELSSGQSEVARSASLNEQNVSALSNN